MATTEAIAGNVTWLTDGLTDWSRTLLMLILRRCWRHFSARSLVCLFVQLSVCMSACLTDSSTACATPHHLSIIVIIIITFASICSRGSSRVFRVEFKVCRATNFYAFAGDYPLKPFCFRAVRRYVRPYVIVHV